MRTIKIVDPVLEAENYCFEHGIVTSPEALGLVETLLDAKKSNENDRIQKYKIAFLSRQVNELPAYLKAA